MAQETLIDILMESKAELLRYATKLMGSTHDGEDLLSNLIVTLLQRGENAERVLSPLPFLKASLRNAAINMRKKNQRTTAVDFNDQYWANLARQRDENLDADLFELMTWLNAQLESCQPDVAEAFRRYYLDGYPLRELAEQLGMSPNTLTQRFRRIRMDIKSRYPKLWATLINALMMLR